MKNSPQLPEHNEHSSSQAAVEIAAIQTQEEFMFIDYLIEEGFTLEEATNLLHLREHLYENPEIRQRIADDHHLQFARWLYEQGEISETAP